MPSYYQNVLGEGMFDYPEFYDFVAERMPPVCRLAEIGVAHGRSGIYLAEKLEELGRDYQLHLIDNWSYGQQHQYEDISQHVLQSGVREAYLITADSLEATKGFEDRSLHFAFIDASHRREDVVADIRLWRYKVRRDGILAGHDASSSGVRAALRETIPGKIRHYMPTYNQYGVWWVDMADWDFEDAQV
jgi:predicted O-methyltransferase YrrM